MAIKRDTLRKRQRDTRKKSRKMRGGGDLDPKGWAHNGEGAIVDGNPTSNGPTAYFKHSQKLRAGDVWKMRLERGQNAAVGFASDKYNVENHSDTYKNTALVTMYDGATDIDTGISQDSHQHLTFPSHLNYRIPDAPYDVALRCDKDGNVPQIQFNNECAWHDFAPGRAALSEGPYFPFLQLSHGDKLSSHSIVRPKATKSAGKAGKEAMAAKAAGAGASSASRPASSNARKTRVLGRSKSAIPRTVSTRQKSKKKTP